MTPPAGATDCCSVTTRSASSTTTLGEASILIKHTEVLPGHEGKGFGTRLVQGALDYVRGQGKTVIPICPFTLNWVRGHPEYHDVVREDMRKTL